jgi:N-acetylmuramoyl-L-alanine amidase-like
MVASGAPAVERRIVLSHWIFVLVVAVLLSARPSPGAARRSAALDGTARTVAGLFARAHAARWDTLAIGDRIGRFARALEGTPYADGTLEGPGPEVCRVTTRGFDCVTLIETCLNLARLERRSDSRDVPPDLADLQAAVTATRYRGGRLDGYASRLHYTSEWIADNVSRGVLADVTPTLGGEPLDVHVGFMSSHPDRYPALHHRPALVDTLRVIERRINTIPRTFIPRERVAAVEPKLLTGDLIAITTSVVGLDYSHTGLIYRDTKGVARFLHASSAQGKVVLDTSLSGYLARGPNSNTGITVLRALEPPR